MIYVNRVLNLKKIELIGFDMDYTLVQYNTREFESLAHKEACKLLTEQRGYPRELMELEFKYERAILGLVIDTRNGNLLKLSRFGKVKQAHHGLEEIHYQKVQRLYTNVAIELRDPDFIPLDTSFAISCGVLYSQLVDLKDRGIDIPEYRQMARDINEVINDIHQNGSIKEIVLDNPQRFVEDDPKVAHLLERYVDYGKKLMIITNSDYAYTQKLLDHALNPHFKSHRRWQDVFDIVITLADKPRFFQQQNRFFRIDPESGNMTNYNGTVDSGIFQGGWFRKLQDDLHLPGSKILYLGDHIYGDVVAIKKLCDWRTGLVISDLENELRGIQQAKPIQHEIDRLGSVKARLEERISSLDIARYNGENEGTDAGATKEELNRLFAEIENLNNEISELLSQYRKHFNPYWGEVLRSGMEESRYADQIVNYACVYMPRISDLHAYSPKTYFRPLRRSMAHELGDEFS